ncbi:hypothetical protein [Pontibacter arcticus]|uniref:Uncharacterized protein n=1 Tax=Pontibacter arcticus TaxID=2080288 RepID=A0A364RGW8_9BACT|nr:hypothetical protein [Pontibacter arcticus]RAU83580.1 hypothetical protein DP923_00420 [Pontibacter arcticus]
MKTLYTFAIIVLTGVAGIQTVAAQTYPANPAATAQDSTTAGTQKASKKTKEKKETKKRTRVVMSSEVLRTSMVKRSDISPNKVEVVIKQAGRVINNPNDLQMVGSNGTVVNLSNYIGFENMELPFDGYVRFRAQNLMNNSVYERQVRFVVTDPGQWVLRIEL